MKAFLGNLTYNQGQEFGVMISDASFDELSRFNEWASTYENGGTTYNGLGTNIKNSFIVCAPQSTSTYNIVTTTTTSQFIDTNDNDVYEEGTDVNIGSTTTSYSSLIEYIDNGKYDLLVTDHLGNLIRLTPPFTDIDTNFFDLKDPDLSLDYSDNKDGSHTLYNTRALTFNSSYVNLLNNSSKVIERMNVTYTPILDTIKEYGDDDVNPISSKVTIAYSYVTSTSITGAKNLYWGTFSYDYTDKDKTTLDNDGLHYDYAKDKDLSNIVNTKNSYFTPYVVSWQSLLSSYIALEERVQELERQTDPKNPNSMAYNLQKQINELNSRKYMYRAYDNVPTYIWSGTISEYNSFIDYAKKNGKNLDDYIFIHQN